MSRFRCVKLGHFWFKSDLDLCNHIAQKNETPPQVQMPWPKCIAALLLHLLKPSVKIVPDNYKYLDLQKKKGRARV